MKFFYVLVILFLMLGVISPIVTTTDAVSDSFLIFQVISAPYDLVPAGEFRGNNYGLAGVWADLHGV